MTIRMTIFALSVVGLGLAVRAIFAEQPPNHVLKFETTTSAQQPAAPAAATKANATRPNILFFFADDQRNHTLACAGHPIVKTPNIDRLAADGVRFENAFVTTSTCWVSRACLFTGCYERRHLYRINPGPLDPDLCAPRTLPS